jgi:aldose 1-epimerase
VTDQAAAAGRRRIDGFEALTLESSALGGIEAAFVPEAGMICCSLRHRGEELLGQRGGLGRYVRERSTMGVPLLYPWANRLSAWRFDVADVEVALDGSGARPSTDPAGLPIHGLMAAAAGWEITRHEGAGDRALLSARFDFGEHEDLMTAFPFSHLLEIEAELAGTRLTILTRVTATGDVRVPIAFGYHPYLRLPGAPRADWVAELPLRTRLELDRRMLPTGAREAFDPFFGALGDRTFDDEFVAPERAEPLAIAAGGRRIEVRLGDGYPFTQIYAPPDDEVIAIEPMTAPTNALVTGDRLTWADPGRSGEATFSIAISS